MATSIKWPWKKCQPRREQLNALLIFCSAFFWVAWSGHASVHRGALELEIKSTDPLAAEDTNAQFVILNAWDGLVDWDPRLGIVPAVAEKWTISNDGLSYRFKIRDGLRFQSGVRLTADHVRAHFFRALQTKGYFKDHFQEVSGVRVENCFVVFDLARPDTHFLNRLAGVPGRIVRKIGEGWEGVGPFVLTLTKGGGAILTARDDHVEPKVTVKRFEFFPMSLASALEAARKNRIHDMLLYSLSQRDLAPLSSGVREFSIWETWLIAFNSQSKRLLDPVVRAWARYQLQASGFNDRVMIGQTQAWNIVPPGVPGFLEELKLVVPQVELKRVSTVEILIAQEIPRHDDWRAWLSDASKLGKVRFQPVFVPFRDVLDRMGTGRFSGALIGFNGEYPDPFFLMRSLVSGSRSDFFKARSEVLEQLTQSFRSASQPENLPAIQIAASRELHRLAVAAPLIHLRHVTWVSPCVQGVVNRFVSEAYFSIRGVRHDCQPSAGP